MLFCGKAEDALTSAELPAPVAMAYLDPPYNTGRKFSQYSDSSPVAAWMAMMDGALRGAREVLAESGSVWVHLDDRYIHRIRCLMDDIYGAENYVGTIIWEKKNRASFLHAHLADVTDHILIYAKDKSQMPPLVHSSTEAGKRIPIHNKGNKVTVLEFPAGSMRFGFSDRTIPAGPMNTESIASELLDDLTIADGVNTAPFRMSGPFRYSQDTVTKMSAVDGPAFICPREKLRPSYLSVESKDKVLTNLQSFRVNGAPTNEDGRAESEMIFGTGHQSFDTPKPERLLERFIAAATREGETVLDPFAGSGTTLAVAQKMGRAWIGVEKSPATIETYIRPRLDGVIAGTDPLPLPGWAASTEAYTVTETQGLRAA